MLNKLLKNGSGKMAALPLQMRILANICDLISNQSKLTGNQRASSN